MTSPARRQHRLQRNPGLLSALAFLNSFLLIVPVWVPLFMSKGASLAEVFYLQALFSATMVLAEVPSGYVADLLGRRLALLAGTLLRAISFSVLWVADGFVGLALFEVILGIALSLHSGADLALLYDSHIALGHERPRQVRGLARLRVATSVAKAGAAVSGGVLAMVSFDFLVDVQMVVAWLPVLVVLLLTEAPVERLDRGRHGDNLRQVWRHLWSGDRLLRQIFLTIPACSLMFTFAVWLIQPYWGEAGINIAWFGVLWGLTNLVTGGSAQQAGRLERRLGAPALLLLIGALPVLGYLGLLLSPYVVGVVLCMSIFAARGLAQVILVDALNQRLPGAFRATANSLAEFAFRLGFVISGPPLGWIAEQFGIGWAFALCVLLAALVWLVVMLPLARSVPSVRIAQPARKETRGHGD